MGLDVYLQRRGSEDSIEIPSKTDPEHYFKIGYFRSSYNSGGIERVIDRLIGKSPLHEIFQPGDEYEFTPDWNRALDTCNVLIKEVENALQGERAKYDCFNVSAVNLYAKDAEGVTDDRQALDLFFKEKRAREAREASFSHYSNLAGEWIFTKEPLRVRAMIRGTSCLGQLSLYVVYENEGEWDWYVKALAIVKETIEWVLSQPDTSCFYLCWSS